MLDAINQYPPVVGINGLAAIAFMVGYVLFGIAMIKTASLPRLAGILVAVGAPSPSDRLRRGPTRLPRPVADRRRRQHPPGRRPGLAGYRLWSAPATRGRSPIDKRPGA